MILTPTGAAATPPTERLERPAMDGKDATFVQTLVASFTRMERQIIALHYVENLTIPEVGSVLDLPQHEVESMLSSVRERTREAVDARRMNPVPIA